MVKKDNTKLKAITVEELIQALKERFAIQTLTECEGVKRLTRNPSFIYPGLAFLGHSVEAKGESIVLIGETEHEYLSKFDAEGMRKAAENLAQDNIITVVSLDSRQMPPEFTASLAEKGIPSIIASATEKEFCSAVDEILSSKFSMKTLLHGELVDIWGVGILLVGRSGVGKSECALELISRGHRLVADDHVQITVNRENELIGTSPELLRYHMEIRGLGIVNVYQLFGPSAIRRDKRIDLIIELTEWEKLEDDYDRLGEKEKNFNILGIPVPYICVPVHPGRNISVVIEVAARNFLLKKEGVYSAKEFIAKLDDKIKNGGK